MAGVDDFQGFGDKLQRELSKVDRHHPDDRPHVKRFVCRYDGNVTEGTMATSTCITAVMSRHPYPNEEKPQTTIEGGGSVRITIPSGVRDALALEAGEEPEVVRYDPDERHVSFQFGD